jgi:protein SCO1/2
VRFEDQAGNPTRAADLEGRPLAVSFLFTRCDNPLKCPLIAKRMAALQQALPAAGLEGKVNLALITYDPEYDTPRQLATWGAAQGLTFDACTRMLRPNPQQKTGLFDALNIDVNYGAGGVNIHRIQLLLFDRRGRFARSHHTVIWDQPRVLADLQRLASE